jgi:hypothetical protein
LVDLKMATAKQPLATGCSGSTPGSPSRLICSADAVMIALAPITRTMEMWIKLGQ